MVGKREVTTTNKTIALLVVLIFAMYTLTLPAVALAENSSWVRVCEEGVFLYANNYSQKVLFILQKSYYLSVIAQEDTMLYVSVMGENDNFPAITGYVWTSQVKQCKSAPDSPYYPTVSVTVNTDSAAVKLSPVPSAQTLVVATNTQRLSFYGEIISYGEQWYYVYYGGKFGYVRAQMVTQPNVQPHPTPIETVVVPTVTPEVDPSPTTPEQNTTTTGAEIVMIAFVVLLALGLALAVLLPGNTKRRDNGVFDSNI